MKRSIRSSPGRSAQRSANHGTSRRSVPRGASPAPDRVDDSGRPRGDECPAGARLDPVDAQEELTAGDAVQCAGRAVVEVPALARQLPGLAVARVSHGEELTRVLRQVPGARAEEVVDRGDHPRAPDLREAMRVCDCRGPRRSDCESWRGRPRRQPSRRDPGEHLFAQLARHTRVARAGEPQDPALLELQSLLAAQHDRAIPMRA